MVIWWQLEVSTWQSTCLMCQNANLVVSRVKNKNKIKNIPRSSVSRAPSVPFPGGDMLRRVSGMFTMMAVRCMAVTVPIKKIAYIDYLVKVKKKM